MIVYRLIAKHPAKWGCCETAHKSMDELNAYEHELRSLGYNEFIIDSWVRNI